LQGRKTNGNKVKYVKKKQAQEIPIKNRKARKSKRENRKEKEGV